MISPERLKCQCGCGLNISAGLREKILKFEADYKTQFIISCGARCIAHNKAIGGASASPHLPLPECVAFDCAGNGIDIDALYKKVEASKLFTRMGLNRWNYKLIPDKANPGQFIKHPQTPYMHIDIKKPEGIYIITRWTYDEYDKAHNA